MRRANAIKVRANAIKMPEGQNFMENMSVLKKCNILHNNYHLLLIWLFLLIDNEFDLKITIRILNPEKHPVY